MAGTVTVRTASLGYVAHVSLRPWAGHDLTWTKNPAEAMRFPEEGAAYDGMLRLAPKRATLIIEPAPLPELDATELAYLEGLALRLQPATSRGALKVLTPGGEQYPIIRVELRGPGYVVLHTYEGNRPARELHYTTYTDLLDAVIAAAAR